MAAEITAKDKELARASWAYVDKDYVAVGNVLFRELFTAYPDYVKFFEKMKSSPDEDLLESARFKKHMVSALFPAIAQMLENIEAPEKLKAQLQGIGDNHKKRNLTRQNFEAIHKVILITFKQVLGDKFTSETEAAWNKILTLTFDKISTAMEKGQL